MLDITFDHTQSEPYGITEGEVHAFAESLCDAANAAMNTEFERTKTPPAPSIATEVVANLIKDNGDRGIVMATEILLQLIKRQMRSNPLEEMIRSMQQGKPQGASQGSCGCSGCQECGDTDEKEEAGN